MLATEIKRFVKMIFAAVRKREKEQEIEQKQEQEWNRERMMKDS